MTQKFTDSHATRIIAALETRMGRKTQDGAHVQTTWGTIGALDSAYTMASAYLYGETDGAYISAGFRVPETMYPSIGDVVKVAINHDTGERWVEEINVPSDYKKIVVDIKNGKILFGDGTEAPPFSLYNGEIGTLSTDAYFEVTRPTTVYTGYGVKAFGDSWPRWYVIVDGKTWWGAGTGAGDTNLYRSAAGLLKTDDRFEIGKDGGKTTLQLVNTGTNTGITLGGDTNLYRHSANVLRTDDDVYVGAPTTASSSGVIISMDGSIEIVREASNPFIDFKNAAGDDYDVRLIYSPSGSDKLEVVGKVFKGGSGIEIASGRVARYVHLSTLLSVLSTATSSNVGRTHIADIGTIPTDAVAVSIMMMVVHTSISSGNRINIFGYGSASEYYALQMATGKVANHYEGNAIAWVTLGGTNNRQFDYDITIGTAGTTTLSVWVTGYWTYN